MSDSLVVIIARSGLKQLSNIFSIFPNFEKVVAGPSGDIEIPDGKYERVVVVDSSAATCMSLISIAEEVRRKCSAKVHLAATPKTRYAEAVVDLRLPPPEHPNEGKPLFMISGFPGTGKSAIAWAVAELNGLTRVKWGSLIRENFDPGLYGEKLAKLEMRDPYAVPIRVFPALSKIAMECNGLVIDGVKTVEQVTCLSFGLGGTPIPMYADLYDRSLRILNIMVRGMEDDSHWRERDEMLTRLGLARLGRLAGKIFIDGVTMEDAIPDPGLRVFLHPFVRDMHIRGRFNPFGKKMAILDAYYRYVEKARPVDPDFVKKEAEKVAGELKRMGFLHTGYVERLRMSGAGLDGKMEKFITYTATAFRLIDDILDENRYRYMSEEERTVESPWWRMGIFKSVVWASLLTIVARDMVSRNVFMKWFPRIINAVKNEIALEESGRDPAIDDWLVAVARESAYRAMVAELLCMDWRRAYLEGIISQIKDDMGPGKGGREETEERLNRPLAARVFTRVELEELMESIESAIRSVDRTEK